MCGIAGIFDTQTTRDIDQVLLSSMNQQQHHRGPDETGVHFEPGIGLAHKRLSIIDLSSGQQPLFNEDKSVAVVFNGEIYNHPELMKELTAQGHIFHTHCDTEVIVHAWEQWGEQCVTHFRGMFAFGLWDRNLQTLFLARDRMGVKPLFYALLDDGQFIFGSELKVLTAHPGLKRNIDVCAVEEYFAYGYVPEPRTIYRQALKLAPAHTLTIRRDQALLPPRAYWDVCFDNTTSVRQADVQPEFIDRLSEAVKIRLMAEVPLGAFLSGGVDSSAVVAMMANLMDTPVNTCSIGFNDPVYNESEFAAQVAQRYQTNHTLEMVDTDDYGLIDTLAALYDEPYADSSAIPTYRVCQLAKKRVTVALSGDGGDETFAGYRRYRWHMKEERVRNLLPLSVRRPLFGFLGSVYPKADWAPKPFRAKTTLQALARSGMEAYFHSVSFVSDELRGKLFSASFKRELQGYQAIEVMRRHAVNAPEHPLSAIQYLDYKTYLAGDINTKVDRASMAHALEVREPLMDHKLIEWAATLPPDIKLHGNEGKYLFKKSMESYLPHEVLYRQKMGFSVPLANWLRGPLSAQARGALTGAHISDSGIFDMNFVVQMLDGHQSGLYDYSTPIWTLLMFEAFLRAQLTSHP
jgi:asparagine synthase (glutamine-hydrolysing)